MAKEIINPIFYDEKGTLLPEFKKFNWGACIFCFIWGIPNRCYITLLALLAFIPSLSLILGLIFPIWFGFKGNAWAIKNKEWQSVEHFNHVQKLWAIWAFIVSLIILIPLIIAYALLLVWLVNNPEQAQEMIIKMGI